MPILGHYSIVLSFVSFFHCRPLLSLLPQFVGLCLYPLMDQCNQRDTDRWEGKLLLFNVIVTQLLVYGIEVWGGTIHPNAWNQTEKILNVFWRWQLGVNPLPPTRLCSWKQVFNLKKYIGIKKSMQIIIKAKSLITKTHSVFFICTRCS